MRRKCLRRLSAVCRPLRAATVSTGRSQVSSRRWASRVRSRRIHWYGVVPVMATNLRAKVRGLMAARAARSSTVTGWCRFSCSQAIVSFSRLSGTGMGWSMYWAWPPSRCGGTTRSRASLVATSLP
jgi:hypothetical protein